VPHTNRKRVGSLCFHSPEYMVDRIWIWTFICPFYSFLDRHTQCHTNAVLWMPYQSSLQPFGKAIYSDFQHHSHPVHLLKALALASPATVQGCDPAAAAHPSSQPRSAFDSQIISSPLWGLLLLLRAWERQPPLSGRYGSCDQRRYSTKLCHRLCDWISYEWKWFDGDTSRPSLSLHNRLLGTLGCFREGG
jgi:hypothetical protein